MSEDLHHLLALAAAQGRTIDASPLRYKPIPTTQPLPSDTARWTDLVDAVHDHEAVDLDLPRSWPDTWQVTWNDGCGEQTEVVRDLEPRWILRSVPMRSASWHRHSTTRAGLYASASLGGHQWHESLFERTLLVALDFDPAVSAVRSQPFTLTWTDGSRRVRHTPDFLIECDSRLVIVNVRPGQRMNLSLLRNAAALHRLARFHLFGDMLVVGYRRPALTVLESLRANADAFDVFDLGLLLLARLEAGPATFGDLVSETPAPALARAVLQRLLWDRQACVDLSSVLTDRSVIHLGASPVGGQ